jgi:hypothetical protein
MISKNNILIQQKWHLEVETMDLYLQMAEAFCRPDVRQGQGCPLGPGDRKARTGPRGGCHQQHLGGGGWGSHARSRASTGMSPSHRLATRASLTMEATWPWSCHTSLVSECSRVTGIRDDEERRQGSVRAFFRSPADDGVWSAHRYHVAASLHMYD